MALTDMRLGDELKPMSELGNYQIEQGDTDPRGWTVVTNSGDRLGVVEDLIVDTSAMKVRYLVVDTDADGVSSGGRNDAVVVSVADVDMVEGQHQVLARRLSGHEFDASSGAYSYTRSAERASEQRDTDADLRGEARLTRSEEELQIGKREVSRGEARVGKHVETEHVREPVTRRREEVVVERRPVEAGARADATISDDEVRIPLMEEEVVVEKRPVVKEELVVGKRVIEERDVVEAEVRREEFDIDTPGTETPRDRSRRGDR